MQTLDIQFIRTELGAIASRMAALGPYIKSLNISEDAKKRQLKIWAECQHKCQIIDAILASKIPVAERLSAIDRVDVKGIVSRTIGNTLAKLRQRLRNI